MTTVCEFERVDRLPEVGVRFQRLLQRFTADRRNRLDDEAAEAISEIDAFARPGRLAERLADRLAAFDRVPQPKRAAGPGDILDAEAISADCTRVPERLFDVLHHSWQIEVRHATVLAFEEQLVRRHCLADRRVVAQLFLGRRDCLNVGDGDLQRPSPPREFFEWTTTV